MISATERINVDEKVKEQLAVKGRQARKHSQTHPSEKGRGARSRNGEASLENTENKDNKDDKDMNHTWGTR